MSDRIDQHIGNYRLIRMLGEGGFAEVYLGEHRYLGSQAAIKLLHTHVAQSDIAQFQQEGRMLASLIHPHIVRVLDFGIEERTPYLIMDYAPGGTLRIRHPRGTRLPLTTVMQYARQIGQALQSAHEQKVIHRDIKPENMLLGRTGEILLSDFGIALIAQSSRYQSTKDMAGTIAYMAPEQIEAHPHPASDQYSLGIVIYEWLSGTCPFRGTFTEIAIKHSVAAPPSLLEQLPSLPSAVEQVLLTALAKKPEERFASIRSFINALEQASTIKSTIKSTHPATTSPSPPAIPLGQSSIIKADLPVTLHATALEPLTTQPPASELLTTQASSHIQERMRQQQQEEFSVTSSPSDMRPSTFALSSTSYSSPGPISRRGILTGLAVLVAGGGGILWLTRNTSFFTYPFIYSGHSADVNAIIWSPDSRYIASGSKDGTAQVWNATNGNLHYIYSGHAGAVNAVAWSPDGQRIASGSSDYTVQVWNAANGRRLYTYKGHSSDVYTLAWSPDSKHIASGGHDGTVQVWNAVNGSQPYTYKGHTGLINMVSWSPDGKRVASGSGDHTVQVWNAINGNQRYIYDGHSAMVNTAAWSPDGTYIASGGYDRTVQVWNAIIGSQRYIYNGHAGVVNTAAWSPNSQRILSGDSNSSIQVWNATDGSQSITYLDHSQDVNTVAWSPDGKHIASGGDDKVVLVWALQQIPS